VTGRRIRLFGRAAASDQADRPAAEDTPVRSIEAERAGLSAPPPAAALVIDALGRKCPIPIIMLAEQIRDVPLGAVVAVLADDPAAYTDIPSWCTMKAHEFAGHAELPQGGWALFIRRRLLSPGRLSPGRPSGRLEPAGEARVVLPPGPAGIVPGRLLPRRHGGLERRVPGVQVGVDPGRVGLVLAHQLDQLRGQERQADEVTEDPQRSPADDLVRLEGVPPRGGTP
jgi:tRNA 2-thiouridine synthesizing protein A